MRKTEGQKTIEKLIDQGWKISHDATVNRYKFAGSISPMKPKKGNEYCRVHHGKNIGSHSWQITTVLYRKLEVEKQ